MNNQAQAFEQRKALAILRARMADSKRSRLERMADRKAFVEGTLGLLAEHERRIARRDRLAAEAFTAGELFVVVE